MPTKLTDAPDVSQSPPCVNQAVVRSTGANRPHATAVVRTRHTIDPRPVHLAEGHGAVIEPKKVVDWDLIEIDFRAGVTTLEQIGKVHGVSKGRISQVAKAKAWARDLNPKIQARADAKVQAKAARDKLNTEALNDPAKREKRRLAESEVVEANAEVQFRIRMEHRQDICRTRALFRSMLEELEVASSKEGSALIEDLVEVMSPTADGESRSVQEQRLSAQRRLLDKVLGGPQRIESAKKLTEMLEKLVKMEREAHGVDNTKGGEGGYESLLKQVIQAD